ncbi:hypothetical protein O5558_03645 [Escherichia coli]|nr:hypothetical protein [Escherichia coli]
MMTAEQEPEIHSGDAIAFVTASRKKSFLQIQCRISDEECRGQLIHALAARIQSEFGVTAAIDLLPPHSILPNVLRQACPCGSEKTLSEGLCCQS